MKKEILDEWVENLTNGKYQQSENLLCSDTGFCCLGVLTDMYIKKHKLSWDYNKENKFSSIGGEHAMLPEAVAKWAEFDEDILIRASLLNQSAIYDIKLHIVVDEDSYHEDVTSANDYGESFEDIAKALKEQIVTH